MPEPFILYPTGIIGDLTMNAGVPMVGAQQGVPLMSATLPGQTFAALGTGEFPVSNITGRQGAIDVWFKTGAVGSARALVGLVNKTTGQYMQIIVDANNKVQLVHTDINGTTVAAITAQLAAEGTGVGLRYRYSWNSQAAIDGSRFAKFRKNEEVVTTWGTNPTALWTPFDPTHVCIGFMPSGIGTGAVFNGTIQKVQIGSGIVTA